MLESLFLVRSDPSPRYSGGGGGGGGLGGRERDNLARSLMLYFLFLDSCLYSVFSFIGIVCPNILAVFMTSMIDGWYKLRIRVILNLANYLSLRSMFT